VLEYGNAGNMLGADMIHRRNVSTISVTGAPGVLIDGVNPYDEDEYEDDETDDAELYRNQSSIIDRFKRTCQIS
jgi:hypothetical protein